MPIRLLLFFTASLLHAQKCTSLPATDAKQLPIAKTVIDSAVLNPARAAQAAAAALPEHCEVLGKINERVGFNSQRYAIQFHLRLPTQWNGKFFFEGGGGTNGNLGTAMGNLQGSQRTNALTLGYAVVSQDSGHDNNVNNNPGLNGASSFAFDPQARIDLSYNSYDQVAQTAKALIRTYYGRAAERSYFAGCSEGGREGLMFSQRFPDYFDGILVCAPGIRIPLAAIAQAWNVQTFAEAAKAAGVYDRYGQPFVNKAFSDEDLAVVATAVLDACDALDGAKDGIVANFLECNGAAVRPKLEAATCRGPKRSTCLAAAQITALEKVFSGPKNAKGDALYSDWAWDSGVSGKSGDRYNQGWRSWSMGDFEAAANTSISTTLVAPSMGALSAPPEVISTAAPAPMQYLLQLDFNTMPERMRATSRPNYPVSPWDLLNVGGTDLTAFKNHGGKLLMAHGVSDPIFSVKDSIKWWSDLNTANGGNAAQFARLFPVPGMNHCAGGPATDQFDAFGALVNWVEKNTAPDMIIGTAGANSPWPNRTRPLCAYPKIARYKGSGSLEDAASFTCQ